MERRCTSKRLRALEWNLFCEALQAASLVPIYMSHYPSQLFLKQANLPSAQFLFKWSHVSSWQTGGKPMVSLLHWVQN